MSVLMTMRVPGNPDDLERIAGEDPQRVQSIAERAKEEGLIAHRFYGTDDGEMMVLDMWPDAQSFQRFFESKRVRQLARRGQAR
jgi:heme-degrading monooxygenase HmoA